MSRNHKLDNIRAIAILAVVFGHSIILYSSSWSTYEPARNSAFLDYIKQFINLFQMPLFFSLSGYLLSFSGCHSKFIPFMGKKFFRLFIPFFTVGIFLMIPLKTLLGHPAYADVSFLSSIKRLLLGYESGHLWYLPTLLFIFAVAFWIVKLSNRLPYFLLPAFVLAIVVHYFRRYVPSFGIPYQYSMLQHIWSFLLGSVIYTFKLEYRLKKHKYIFAAATCIFCVLDILYDRADIIVSALIVLTIYLWTPDCESKFLRTLSKDSFGIYLFHSPLIYITFTFLLNAPPILTVGTNFFVWGTLALIMTEVVRKSRFKFVIGE